MLDLRGLIRIRRPPPVADRSDSDIDWRPEATSGKGKPRKGATSMRKPDRTSGGHWVARLVRLRREELEFMNEYRNVSVELVAMRADR